MRFTRRLLFKQPKNLGVAPRFDTWYQRYEPWEHMKRMGRLVGTGFYIPPEWYSHFRMFPPIHNNYQQEQTLNPHNESEPTQDPTGTLSAERVALRDELARKSRLMASEGMRYYNVYWVRKPLDRMEREYYNLKRKGVPHAVAIKKALEGFYCELTAKKRVAAIQAEEAKLSGKFISMREATVVMKVLTQLQREQLTPHQVALLAKEQRDLTREGESLSATVVHSNAEAMPGTVPTTEEAVSADSLADLLAGDEAAANEGGASAAALTVTTSRTPYDSVKQLEDMATDGTGSVEWYTGASASMDTPAAAAAAVAERPHTERRT